MICSGSAVLLSDILSITDIMIDYFKLNTWKEI